MPLVILLFVLMIATPLTVEMHTRPLDGDCEHVVVQTWFGLFKHVDTVVCGDDKVRISIGQEDDADR